MVNVKTPFCEQTQFSIQSFVYDSKQMFGGMEGQKYPKKENDWAICFIQLWSVRKEKADLVQLHHCTKGEHETWEANCLIQDLTES